MQMLLLLLLWFLHKKKVGVNESLKINVQRGFGRRYRKDIKKLKFKPLLKKRKGRTYLLARKGVQVANASVMKQCKV